MFSSHTCNRRSHLWDYVEPREAFCYFLRIVSPNGCLVLPLAGTPFSSFLLSPLFSFLLLSSFLEGGNKYVLSCVIQHEAGGLSKKAFGATDGFAVDNRLTFGVDRAVWTLAAKMDDGAPWHKGVLQGAEKIMASWHKEEEEANR